MTARDGEWSDEKWAVRGLLALLFVCIVALSFTGGDNSVVATVAPIETTGQSAR
jgi:hypothetical protein